VGASADRSVWVSGVVGGGSLRIWQGPREGRGGRGGRWGLLPGEQGLIASADPTTFSGPVSGRLDSNRESGSGGLVGTEACGKFGEGGGLVLEASHPLSPPPPPLSLGYSGVWVFLGPVCGEGEWGGGWCNSEATAWRRVGGWAATPSQVEQPAPSCSLSRCVPGAAGAKPPSGVVVAG